MPELKCEILKMPHHGAFYDEKSGIGLKQILEILQPRDVIISSGDNKKYKHPDIQTIEVLFVSFFKYASVDSATLGYIKNNFDLSFEINSLFWTEVSFCPLSNVIRCFL